MDVARLQGGGRGRGGRLDLKWEDGDTDRWARLVQSGLRSPARRWSYTRGSGLVDRLKKLPIAPDCEVSTAVLGDGESGDLYLVKHRHSGRWRVVRTTFVDFRERRRPLSGSVLRFNRQEDSPEVTGQILLRTSGFYHGLEGGDELDGAVSVDYSSVVAQGLMKRGMSVAEGSFSATAVFGSMHEPWIYCTSIGSPDWATGQELERRFSKEKGPDAAVAVIEDRELFAAQLGVDVALGIEAGVDISVDGMQLLREYRWRLALGGEEVDALVDVVHGPVAYRDENPTIRTHSDLPDATRVCFTKRRRFAEEHEYRFAVFAGDSKVDTIELGVSNALGDLMTIRHMTDRRWYRS